MTLKSRLAWLRIDPFLILLVATVGLAALLPARGAAAPLMGWVSDAVVALLFFVYGARLAPKAVLEGLSHWRLQSLVFASTFVLFPLLGLALTFALRPFLPHELSVGLMFVCVLPSTVQSSIAFTGIARGNVSAALCSASVSNLLGVLLTPLLVVLLLDAHGAGFSPRALEDIGLQLLVPFAAGQLVRPLIGPWLLRNKDRHHHRRPRLRPGRRLRRLQRGHGQRHLVPGQPGQRRRDHRPGHGAARSRPARHHRDQPPARLLARG